MGLEEVSKLDDLPMLLCKLELCKLNMKDANVSRKESFMRIKKRILALLMCVMMIMSAMSIWAEYGRKTLGGTSSESAFYKLYMYSKSRSAYTTPASVANPVSTTLRAYNSGGAVLDDGIGTYNASVYNAC